MAGNRPNTAPNNVQDQLHEQIPENTRITEIKNAVSSKLDRLCDAIKGCAASGALALTLAATPVNAQSTNTREVTMETVVVIAGKEYTYGQLYNMSSEMMTETLRKIPNRGERERVRSGIINLQDKAIVQARAENQRVRMREQQVNDLNQSFAIATNPNTPQRERAAAIQHVLRLVDELGLSEKEQADTIKAMEYAAKL